MPIERVNKMGFDKDTYFFNCSNTNPFIQRKILNSLFPEQCMSAAEYMEGEIAGPPKNYKGTAGPSFRQVFEEDFIEERFNL